MPNTEGTSWEHPYKLTRTRERKIIAALERGATIRFAAFAGDISYRTLRYWLNSARNGGPDHPAAKMLLACEAAQAKFNNQLIDMIVRKVPDDPRSAIMLLKMMHPDQYAERQEVSGPEGGAVEVKLAFDPTPKPSSTGGTDAAADDEA